MSDAEFLRKMGMVDDDEILATQSPYNFDYSEGEEIVDDLQSTIRLANKFNMANKKTLDLAIELLEIDAHEFEIYIKQLLKIVKKHSFEFEI